MLPTAEEVQYLHRGDMSRYYQQTKKSPVASIIFELLPNIYIHILQPTRTHINPVGSCRRLPAEAVGGHMSSWCTCSAAAADEAKRCTPASGSHLVPLVVWTAPRPNVFPRTAECVAVGEDGSRPSEEGLPGNRWVQDGASCCRRWYTVEGGFMVLMKLS